MLFPAVLRISHPACILVLFRVSSCQKNKNKKQSIPPNLSWIVILSLGSLERCYRRQQVYSWIEQKAKPNGTRKTPRLLLKTNQERATRSKYKSFTHYVNISTAYSRWNVYEDLLTRFSYSFSCSEVFLILV